jgi:hypothetical protein
MEKEVSQFTNRQMYQNDYGNNKLRQSSQEGVQVLSALVS